MKLAGRVWKFGDDLSVFDLLPAKYDNLGVNEKWDECATHLLEELEPTFATGMRPGDVVVAGRDLGAGHSHYYRATVLACNAAGVGALLGETTKELFQRASIDQGLPTWAYPGIGELADNGDQLAMDLATGEATNMTSGRTARFKPLSPVILEILAAGSAFNWAKARAEAERAADRKAR